MDSYWCEKKNSITDWVLYGIDFSPALVLCRKDECDQWRNGKCIHIRKAGQRERPQVFSR